MKSSILSFCLIGLVATTIITTLERTVYEIAEATNTIISLKERLHIERPEDHKDHNDIVSINGKILCEKTEQFYRIK